MRGLFGQTRGLIEIMCIVVVIIVVEVYLSAEQEGLIEEEVRAGGHGGRGRCHAHRGLQRPLGVAACASLQHVVVDEVTQRHVGLVGTALQSRTRVNVMHEVLVQGTWAADHWLRCALIYILQAKLKL